MSMGFCIRSSSQNPASSSPAKDGSKLSQLLGRTEIPTRVVDIEHIVFGEQADNIDRKDFTPEERVAIGGPQQPVDVDSTRPLGARSGHRPPSVTHESRLTRGFPKLMDTASP